MFSIKAIFKPDYERYEGVRPIYLLRLLFLLIVIGVNVPKWQEKASAWRGSAA